MATKNAINSSDPIDVTKGGTGVATLTDHGVLVGSGASAITPLSVGSTGELLVGVTGADPVFGASANADFTFGGANSGATRTFTVSNTTDAASSAANLVVSTGGSSAADPQTTYTVTGQQSYSAGIDNGDSDKFKISASTALGTTDAFVMTSAGEITNPLQPAFLAYNGSASNVTGDSTTYTMSFSSEAYDQNGDFSTTTFTAPVTGKYQFDFSILCTGLTASHTTSETRIVTSNKTYYSGYCDPGAIKSSSGSYAFTFSLCVDMDASDTMTLQVDISNGTKVVSINSESYLSGRLAC